MRRSRRTLILVLFVTFRLSLLFFWPADQMARWSDYDYYYQLASWVDEGKLPYLHYWVEYPPLFPYLSVILYLFAPRYETYATALGLVQLLFQAGSLVLVYRIAQRTLGEARAERIGWVYALLFAPVASWWLSFDAITTFFLLLAIERWMAGRHTQSALAAGVGGLVKWFPLLFVPVVVRFRGGWRQGIVYGVTALLVVAIAFSLFAAFSPAYTLASVRSLGQRASWQTVWALVDGNLGTGAYQANRVDPAGALLPQGNPSVLPTWLRTLLFGSLYSWLWLRIPADGGPRQALRFIALTVVLFFLWSTGWSPQWLGMLAPLVLLSLPLEQGALYTIVLTFINIAEWPVLLSRGMNEWLYLTVSLRTGLFVLLALDVWKRLNGEMRSRGHRV